MDEPDYGRTWAFEAVDVAGDLVASVELPDKELVPRWLKTLDEGESVVRVRMVMASGERVVVWQRR
jgi:hypothetical protein